jgi:hypothetical protein
MSPLKSILAAARAAAQRAARARFSIQPLASSLSLLIFTTLEFRLLATLHASTWSTLIPSYVIQIATGTMPWPHLAGRVLLPKLLRLAMPHATAPQFFTLWLAAIFTLLLLANSLAYFLCRSLGASKPRAAAVTLALAALFLCLQDSLHLGADDLVDALAWLTFAFLAFRQARWYYFLPFFCLAMQSSERALFIAIWCLLTILFSPPEHPRRAAIYATVWTTLILVGHHYIELLRAWNATIPLYTHPLLAGGVPQPLVHGQTWMPAYNLHSISQLWPGSPWHDWAGWATRYDLWAALATIAAAPICLARLGLTNFAARAWLFVIAYLITAFFFGRLVELRLFYPLCPFLIFSYALGPCNQ